MENAQLTVCHRGEEDVAAILKRGDDQSQGNAIQPKSVAKVPRFYACRLDIGGRNFTCIRNSAADSK